MRDRFRGTLGSRGLTLAAWVAVVSGCGRELVVLRQGQAPAPSITLTVNGTLADGTTSTALSASSTIAVEVLSGTPAAAAFRVGNDASFAGQEFVPDEDGLILPWTLIAGDGLRTVYAQGRSELGVVSETASANITVDGDAPAFDRGAPLTSERRFIGDADLVDLPLLATGADQQTSAADLEIALSQDGDGDCATWTYGPYAAGVVSFDLDPSIDEPGRLDEVCGDFAGSAGKKALVVYACLRDQARNVSDRASLGFCYFEDVGGPGPEAPVPLTALGSQSGVILTLSDPNDDSETIEVEYTSSVDGLGNPDWTSSTRQVGSTGQCVPRRIPESTFEIGDLQQYREYFFRLRAIDCAGQTSPPSERVVRAVAQRGTLTLDETRRADVLAIGSDLYMHYPQPGGVLSREVVLHCDSAVHDCLEPSRWSRVSVSVPNRASDAAQPAALFGSESMLVLADVSYNVGAGAWYLNPVICLREDDCTQTASWKSVGTVRSGSDEIRPVAGVVANGAVLLFYAVVKNNSAGDGPAVLGISRCSVNGPSRCQSGADWRNIDLDLTVDPEFRVTAHAIEGATYFGYRTADLWQTAAPTCVGNTVPCMVARAGYAGFGVCERDCNWANAQPSPLTCSAYGCGNIGFRHFYEAPMWDGTPPPSPPMPATVFGIPIDPTPTPLGPPTLGSTPPIYVNVGRVIWAFWQSTIDSATGLESGIERIKVAKCNLLACYQPDDFQTTHSTLPTSFSMQADNLAPRLAVATLPGFGLAEARLVLAYSGGTLQQTTLGTCGVGANATGCPSSFTTVASDFSGVVISRGAGADAPPSLVTVGDNVYLSGTGPDLAAQLHGPPVPTPPRFNIGPAADGVAVAWPEFVDAASTELSYGPRSAEATTLSLRPGDMTAFALPSTSTIDASLAFTTRRGAGTHDILRGAKPFSQVSLRNDSGAASARAIARHGDQLFTAMIGASSMDGEGQILIGRCARTGLCDTDDEWEWVTAADAEVFRSVTLDSDTPRDWFDAEPLVGAVRRTIALTRRADVPELWLVGCDEALGDCTSGPWTSASLGTFSSGEPTQAPSIDIAGDYVIAADLDAASQTARVFSCNGAPLAGGGPQPSCGTTPYHRSVCERFSCSGVNTIPPGERPSNTCLQPSNFESISFGGATGVAVGAHPLWGFVVAQGGPSSLFLRGCPYGTLGGCGSQGPVDCSDIDQWDSVRLPASSAVTALSVLPTTRAHPDFRVTQTADYTEGLYVAYHADGWRLASCFGVPPLQYDFLWPCFALDPQTQTSGGAAQWASTYVAPSLSEPIASSLTLAGEDLVLVFHERERVGVAVCPGSQDCSRSSSWRSTIAARTDVDGEGLMGNGVATLSNGTYVVPLPSESNGSDVSLLVGGRYEAGP